MTVTRMTIKYNKKKANIYWFNDLEDFRNTKIVDGSKKTTTQTSESLADDENLNKALMIDKETETI